MSALLAACSRRTDSFSSEEEVFSVFYSCAGRRCTGENRIPNMEHVCTLKRSKAFTNTWPGFACTPRQQQLLVQWKQSGCSLLAAADPPRVWQTFSLQRSFQALPKRSANFTNNSWFGFSEQSACLYFYTALWVHLSAFNMNYSEQTEAQQRAALSPHFSWVFSSKFLLGNFTLEKGFSPALVSTVACILSLFVHLPSAAPGDSLKPSYSKQRLSQPLNPVHPLFSLFSSCCWFD